MFLVLQVNLTQREEEVLPALLQFGQPRRYVQDGGMSLAERPYGDGSSEAMHWLGGPMGGAWYSSHWTSPEMP